MTRIAILSDPHLHDVRFGAAGAEPGFVWSLADTMRSTRVFNESEAALRATLDAVVAEGITICIIVGDLTDDGQPANWQAVSDLLGGYTQRHGIRFFATPGNHDQWSMIGKPLAKAFVDANGHVETRAGQSIPRRQGAVQCPGMRMVGYDEAMFYAGPFGYRPQPGDLHWETPFGTDPGLNNREARMTSRRGDSAYVCDLSYLVEPVPGLWLLSIDANVYLPDGTGGYVDCSKEGWNATLRHKPYLLDWMRDVAARAQAGNKRLIAFSHYPVTDVFHGCTPVLETLPSSRAGSRQMPCGDVTNAVADTGIDLHFSGHWHVASTAADEGGRLVNVSVPSTVAYPAGWLSVRLADDGLNIAEHSVVQAPGFDRWHERYAAEAAATDGQQDEPEHETYADFLDHHFRHVVLSRRLDEDWPRRTRAMVENGTLADLVQLLGFEPREIPDIPFADVFVDWYRLREAGGGLAADISAERRALYADLARACVGKTFAPGSDAAILSVFLRTLGLLLQGSDRKSAALARLRAVAVPC